ncbi:FkbM family methyltransferase [Ideonella sp. DXS22W]|uniref:FkbM family methyltransferase n=1 Tax=Pseudaquabacterium inlustre TaxID=2984192 RepID=A0ABU9CE11_9BURK
MSLKTTIKRALRAVGLHVYFAAPDALPEHLHGLFSRLGINVVIDVGGHYGEYGTRLRAMGYQGRIVSFEPTSEALAKLRPAASGQGDWRVFDSALGSSPGELDINIAEHTVFNSFLPASEFSRQQFGAETAVARTERVKVETLDRMFDRCVEGVANPRVYLKLDTQGFDLEVLKGARQVLDRVLGLQSEVSVKPIYQGMPAMADALGIFSELGFELTGLYPVTRTEDLAVIEFDCVMRRQAMP